MSDTKEKILNIAFELIQTVGFDSFSYADIARRLEITKASVHHHFPRKEDLGIAVCDFILNMKSTYIEPVLAKETSPKKKLDALFLIMQKGTENCKKTCPVSALMTQFSILPTGMQVKLKKVVQSDIIFMTKILDDGKKSGEMNFSGTPKAQAEFISSALKGGIQYARIEGEQGFLNIIKQIKYSLNYR